MLECNESEVGSGLIFNQKGGYNLMGTSETTTLNPYSTVKTEADRFSETLVTPTTLHGVWKIQILTTLKIH
jgi:hypothetical protein